MQDKVLLTNAQKETLYKRLIWNAHPENLHYRYSQFYDNCATKVRDALDEALGGKIRAAFKEPRRQRAVPLLRQPRSPAADPLVGAGRPRYGIELPARHAGVRLGSRCSCRATCAIRSRACRRTTTTAAYHLPNQPLLQQSKAVVDLPDPPAANLTPILIIALCLGLPLELGLSCCRWAVASGARRSSWV